MQKKIYAYVLSKIKTDSETLSAIKDLMAGSDQFWTSLFDEVPYNKDATIDQLIDGLCGAIIGVKDRIEEYFDDSMNHEPGYKKPKITFTDLEDYDSIPGKDLEKLVDEINPGVLAAAKKEAAERDAKVKAAKAAEIKSITKERLEEVAAYVKKWSAAGWKDFAKVLKTEEWVRENVSSDYGVPAADLKKISGEAIKKIVYDKNEKTPRYNIHSEWENITDMRHGAMSDELTAELPILQNLRIIAGNKALSLKLWDMIK